MFDFDGRVLLLTGAASGIGRATAEYFWRCGARLALGDLNEPALHTLAQQLDPQGGRIMTMRYDAARPDDAQALVNATMQRFGQLDFVVPAAAIYEDQLVRDMADADWERTLAVNLHGVFYLVRRAVAVMRPGGAVVHLASQAAHTGGGVEHAHYGASKAAVVAFTRTLARELGPDIRVNAVSPGVIDTPMVERNLRTRRADVVTATPLKRLGHPSEVASVIAFLCSDAASFVTGEALLVTGGFWMGG